MSTARLRRRRARRPRGEAEPSRDLARERRELPLAFFDDRARASITTARARDDRRRERGDAPDGIGRLDQAARRHEILTLRRRAQPRASEPEARALGAAP